MNQTAFKIKKDKYLAKRGGVAKIITVNCQSCKKLIFYYQKDMPRGWLKRCYLNRILAPEKWEKLQHDQSLTVNSLGNLTCDCDNILGTSMQHKDGRLAYKLIRGKFIRKTAK